MRFVQIPALDEKSGALNEQRYFRSDQITAFERLTADHRVQMADILPPDPDQIGRSLVELIGGEWLVSSLAPGELYDRLVDVK